MNNKEIAEKVEESSTSLKKNSFVEKLQSMKNVDPELVMSWMGGLTELEQILISIMYNINRSETIRAIRMALIGYSVRANIDLYTALGKETKELHFPFKSFYLLSRIQAIELSKIENEDNAEQALKRCEAIQKMIEFPSFRTIDNAIKDLINLGLVNQRSSSELSNQKIKGLYYLNPFIRNLLKKLENEKK